MFFRMEFVSLPAFPPSVLILKYEKPISIKGLLENGVQYRDGVQSALGLWEFMPK